MEKRPEKIQFNQLSIIRTVNHYSVNACTKDMVLTAAKNEYTQIAPHCIPHSIAFCMQEQILVSEREQCPTSIIVYTKSSY